jgi:hypothetical protein
MQTQTAVDWIVNKLYQIVEINDRNFLEHLKNEAKEMEKEQIGYTEEQAYEIWKAGQKYWETSGKSITFEELIEKFKNK